MKQENTSSVSRQEVQRILNEYSKQHHVTPEKMFSIMSDFIMGFEFISELHKSRKSISIFGTARSNDTSADYREAARLGNLLAKDGFSIVTGGGPGIMEAANKGAHEAGGRSVGLNISLKSGQTLNPYVTESKLFTHFFARKTMLEFASQIYIFFPGGFGTLDELFEMVMLIQTKKIPPLPIILVDKSYWEPLLEWIKKSLLGNQYINQEDMNIYHLVDNAQEAYEYIKKLALL